MTGQWLPGKRINLAHSTWDGYRRKIDRHIVPSIGHLRIRRLRAHHLETLYDRMLYPTDVQRALAPKTVLEVHLIMQAEAARTFEKLIDEAHQERPVEDPHNTVEALASNTLTRAFS